VIRRGEKIHDEKRKEDTRWLKKRIYKMIKAKKWSRGREVGKGEGEDL